MSIRMTANDEVGRRFAERFTEISAEAAAERRNWVDEVSKEEGIALIQRDDGWVDREVGSVCVAPYADFVSATPPKPGDRIVLGDPRKYRVGTITWARKGILGPDVYYFREDAP